MAMYRVYRLDGLGKFTAAEWIEADTDDDAMRVVSDTCQSVACEVWDRDRFVGRVSPPE